MLGSNNKGHMTRTTWCAYCKKPVSFDTTEHEEYELVAHRGCLYKHILVHIPKVLWTDLKEHWILQLLVGLFVMMALTTLYYFLRL